MKIDERQSHQWPQEQIKKDFNNSAFHCKGFHKENNKLLLVTLSVNNIQS